MNWEGRGRKRQCLDLRCYSGICLEGLRKTTKNLVKTKKTVRGTESENKRTMGKTA
jgi:hypothetical protein